MSAVTMSGYAKAGRWQGLREFLEDARMACGVKLTITERHTGIVQETIYWSVSGTDTAVERFGRILKESLQ